MLNEIFQEVQRTFFICGIHVLYLLCLKPDNACDGPKNGYSKLSNLDRSIIKFFDQATYFMCQVFIPYAGYLVIAIQYYFLINVLYNWYFPSVIRSLRGGTFGEVEEYSLREDKEFMKEIRGLICLIFQGFCGTVSTSLSPVELHFLRLWELRTVSKKKTGVQPNITRSLLHNIPDPRNEFLRFGTAYDDTNLSMVISDEKFSCQKDFSQFAMKWIMDIVKGVQYLHDRDIHHLNLQPESILLNFGSKFQPMASKALIGNFQGKQCDLDNYVPFWTPRLPACYRPPEAFLFGSKLPKATAAEKCDIWGLGIVSLELLTGGALMTNQQFSFDQTKMVVDLLELNYYLATVESAHEYDDDVLLTGQWKTVRENYIWIWLLLNDLLEFDPDVRIGTRAASQHGVVKKLKMILDRETKALT